MENLPEEILPEIFNWLDGKSYKAVTSVSKNFNTEVNRSRAVHKVRLIVDFHNKNSVDNAMLTERSYWKVTFKNLKSENFHENLAIVMEILKYFYISDIYLENAEFKSDEFLQILDNNSEELFGLGIFHSIISPRIINPSNDWNLISESLHFRNLNYFYTINIKGLFSDYIKHFIHTETDVKMFNGNSYFGPSYYPELY